MDRCRGGGCTRAAAGAASWVRRAAPAGSIQPLLELAPKPAQRRHTSPFRTTHPARTAEEAKGLPLLLRARLVP